MHKLPSSKNLSQDEEEFDAIDPGAIIGGRRTRGLKVDYNSSDALRKAGLKPEGDEDEGEDRDMAH